MKNQVYPVFSVKPILNVSPHFVTGIRKNVNFPVTCRVPLQRQGCVTVTRRPSGTTTSRRRPGSRGGRGRSRRSRRGLGPDEIRRRPRFQSR